VTDAILRKKPVFLSSGFGIITLLDTRSLYKVIRETDNIEFAKALKNADAKTTVKLLIKLPKKIAGAVIEDLESLGQVTEEESKECQGKIVSVIRHLEERGKIVV
jgi:flagellar motor switch protein FliG